MTFDDWYATGVMRLRQNDEVEIVGPDGAVIAGRLRVECVFAALGDYIELHNPDGTIYMKGCLTHPDGKADTSHLPTGWRFNNLTRV